MPKYRKWVLSLGILAATPGITMAGPLSFFKWKSDKPAVQQGQSARPSNQQTAEQIAAALRDAKLAGYEIEIEYRDGVATLKGMINDPAQKAKAQQVVSKVAGVKSVNNELTVIAKQTPAAQPGSPAVQTAAGQPPQSSAVRPVNYDAAAIQNNQQTAERIAQALSTAQLDGYDIEIKYQNGAAILSGQVGDAQQRSTAQAVVSRVPGVQFVDNRLGVVGQPSAPSAPQARPTPGQPPIHPVNFPQPGYGPASYQPPAGFPEGGPLPGMPPGAIPPGAIPQGAMMPGPGMVPGMPAAPPAYGYPGPAGEPAVYNMPYMPEHAWPSYAQYPNYAAVNYPSQYSASAWPYIGPFYPYPQVPLGWRKAQLEWDDGYWNLRFSPRTDKWWWFLNPHNWDDSPH